MVKSWLEISLAELPLDTIVYKNYFMQRIEKQCSSWNFLLILPSARRGKAMTHLCANKHNQGWKESALTKAFNRFNCKRYFTPPGFWKKTNSLILLQITICNGNWNGNFNRNATISKLFAHIPKFMRRGATECEFWYMWNLEWEKRAVCRSDGLLLQKWLQVANTLVHLVQNLPLVCLVPERSRILILGIGSNYKANNSSSRLDNYLIFLYLIA